jgi:hypothetical protein
VANINAVATQAAFENVSGANVVKSGAQPQAVRKTAGRYALSDFAIERTWVQLAERRLAVDG